MSAAKNIAKVVSDNGPAILSGLAVVGVVSTSALSIRATGPALVDIWDAESVEDRKLTMVEKVRVAWPHYIPAAATVLATGAAIIVAQSTNNRRQAVLAGAVSLSEKAFTEYRDKVREIVGEKKQHEVDTEVARQRMEENPPQSSEIIITGGGDQLCYDEISGRYFKSDMETIRKAVNDVNATVLSDMYASVNDFYRLIGLPINGFGEELGWNTDRLLDISFTSHLGEDGRTALSLQYNMQPIRGYYKIGW